MAFIYDSSEKRLCERDVIEWRPAEAHIIACYTCVLLDVFGVAFWLLIGTELLLSITMYLHLSIVCYKKLASMSLS